MYTEILSKGEMTTEMRTSVLSLIYKEKGYRYHLKNYRPIACSNLTFRILGKAMVIAMRPLLSSLRYLPYRCTLQVAFQRDTAIGDAIRHPPSTGYDRAL